jgi:hypothetical protein
MSTAELYGAARPIVVGGTILLIASFVWRLAHANAQSLWRVDYTVILCAIAVVTSGPKSAASHNRTWILCMRSTAAIVGAAWGFGLFYARPIYVIAPMFLAALYLWFEEAAWRERKADQSHDLPPVKTN